MKVDLQEKIIEWIENIGNLASTELPEFIKEVVNYGFYSACISFIFNFLLILGLIAFVRWIYKSHTPRRELEAGWGLLYVIIGGAAFFVFIALCSDIFKETDQALKAAYAPRLYLIERFMK